MLKVSQRILTVDMHAENNHNETQPNHTEMMNVKSQNAKLLEANAKDDLSIVILPISMKNMRRRFFFFAINIHLLLFVFAIC